MLVHVAYMCTAGIHVSKDMMRLCKRKDLYRKWRLRSLAA